MLAVVVLAHIDGNCLFVVYVPPIVRKVVVESVGVDHDVGLRVFDLDEGVVVAVLVGLHVVVLLRCVLAHAQAAAIHAFVGVDRPASVLARASVAVLVRWVRVVVLNFVDVTSDTAHCLR